ncbi:MAG TPA: VCBS repeat-containing protein, partial [Polyangiaceae bacterium]|nr:VCBS repeat-containing protein [Polyangiaceae bacterium]
AVAPGASQGAERGARESPAADERPAAQAVAVHPAEPPTPKVARGGDLSGQLLEQYRRDRGVAPALAPRVDLQVQVAEDERPERVLLLGRDIVVFGPGFKGGTGYTFLTLQPFAEASDIRDLSARDLTGDGAADLVVRGVRRLTDGKAHVEVEVMLVYEVKDEGITRIFGIETAREQKGKRVQGLVQFVPAAGGKAFDILSAPGRASGWNARTYPWAQDQPGDGSLEPLLLPWGGIGSVRYTWNGSQFVRGGG